MPSHNTPAIGFDEGQRAALELRQRAEPGQAVDVGLMLGDLQRRHVLHDRIGAGKAERDVFVFGDAAGVEHDVTRKLRIGAS